MSDERDRRAEQAHTVEQLHLTLETGKALMSLAGVAVVACIDQLRRELPDLWPMIELAGKKRIVDSCCTAVAQRMGQALGQALDSFNGYNRATADLEPPPTPHSEKH